MTKENHQPSASSDEALLRAEKTHLLYANQANSYWLSVFSALMPLGMAYQSDILGQGMAWFVIFLTVATLRYLLTLRYHQHTPEPDQSYRWMRYYTVGAGIAGMTWGFGVLLIATQSPPLIQLLNLFLVYALAAAAVPLLGVYRPAMLAFQLTALTPITLWGLFFFSELHYLLGFILVLYVLGMRVGQKQLEKHIETAHQLRMENRQLIERLHHKNKALEQSNQALTQLSGEDALTGLSNRRLYEERLEMEWRRAARKSQFVAMVVVDIDHFKNYNDTLGHDAGDACLQKVAELLEAEPNRPGDLVVRYGGEEFVFLLPDTGIEGGLTFAGRLRQRLTAARIRHPDSPVSRFVSASLGVSALNASQNDASELFKTADQALYAAKAAGRNRVARYRPPENLEIKSID